MDWNLKMGQDATMPQRFSHLSTFEVQLQSNLEMTPPLFFNYP